MASTSEMETEKKEKAPFELKSKGFDSSLRKLLGGFEVCGASSLWATKGWEPPANDDELEKLDTVVEVNTRSVVQEDLSAAKATGNADNETCGESQTTSSTFGEAEKAVRSTETTTDESPPTKKEATDIDESVPESVPTKQDRGLETTEASHITDEADKGEKLGGEEPLPEKVEDSKGSRWMGIFFVTTLAILVAVVAALYHDGNVSLSSLSHADLKGLGLQAKSALETKLAESAQALVNLKEIVEESVSSFGGHSDEENASEVGSPAEPSGAEEDAAAKKEEELSSVEEEEMDEVLQNTVKDVQDAQSGGDEEGKDSKEAVQNHDDGKADSDSIVPSTETTDEIEEKTDNEPLEHEIPEDTTEDIVIDHETDETQDEDIKPSTENEPSEEENDVDEEHLMQDNFEDAASTLNDDGDAENVEHVPQGRGWGLDSVAQTEDDK